MDIIFVRQLTAMAGLTGMTMLMGQPINAQQVAVAPTEKPAIVSSSKASTATLVEQQQQKYIVKYGKSFKLEGRIVKILEPGDSRLAKLPFNKYGAYIIISNYKGDGFSSTPALVGITALPPTYCERFAILPIIDLASDRDAEAFQKGPQGECPTIFPLEGRCCSAGH
jgi:hypothetical protein